MLVSTPDHARSGQPPGEPAASSGDDFTTVTELPGEPISAEQIDRLMSRYVWATQYCRDRDVVEAGCGAGPGLGLLAATARSVCGGDISTPILNRARAHYGTRIELLNFDAQQLPFADGSKDVLLLFEAIYYLADVNRFVGECQRVLRPGGTLLIVTANKDLWDFHRSAYARQYLGVVELGELLQAHGFRCEFFGYQDTRSSGLRQRVLRPLKKFAVASGLMPKTMGGKRWLKRLVFGPQRPMPAELTARTAAYNPPTPIPGAVADSHHKILYCAATRPARGAQHGEL
jgi:SAM-dependent methyltransferase